MEIINNDSSTVLQHQNQDHNQLEENSTSNQLKDQNDPLVDELDDLTIAAVSTAVTVTKLSSRKELLQKNQNEQHASTTLQPYLSPDKVNENTQSQIQKDITEFQDKLASAKLPSSFNCSGEDEGLQNESSGSDTSNTTTIEVDDIESHNSNNSNCDENDEVKNVVCNGNEKRKSIHDSGSETTLCDDNINLIDNAVLISNDSSNHYLDENYDEDDEGFDALEPPEYLISGMEEVSSTTTDEASSTISGGDEPVVSLFLLKKTLLN